MITATGLRVNKSTEGETLERKVERMVHNNEPISDRASLIYTERKEGVKPAYDIRTDRMELAIEASDKITGSYIARREDRHKEKKEEIKDQSTHTEPPAGSGKPTE